MFNTYAGFSSSICCCLWNASSIAHPGKPLVAGRVFAHRCGSLLNANHILKGATFSCRITPKALQNPATREFTAELARIVGFRASKRQLLPGVLKPWSALTTFVPQLNRKRRGNDQRVNSAELIARRPRPAGKLGQAGSERASGDGPRQRGRQDPPLCGETGNDADHAAEGEPEGRMGLRPGTLQAAERGRTAVSQTQGLTAHLHAVRQAGRDVPGIPELSSDRRNDI